MLFFKLQKHLTMNQRVLKLKHITVYHIYYELLNTSNIFTYHAFTFCQCDKFQGCRQKPKFIFEKGDRSYSFICRVRVEYHEDKIKHF